VERRAEAVGECSLSGARGCVPPCVPQDLPRGFSTQGGTGSVTHQAPTVAITSFRPAHPPPGPAQTPSERSVDVTHMIHGVGVNVQDPGFRELQSSPSPHRAPPSSSHKTGYLNRVPPSCTKTKTEPYRHLVTKRATWKPVRCLICRNPPVSLRYCLP
jgi:hypothetical protein